NNCVGSPRHGVPSEREAPRVPVDQPPSGAPPSTQEGRGLRLWFLEPADSPHVVRVQQASNAAGLTFSLLGSIDAAPSNAALVGVGPSVPDPLRVARQLRGSGSQALLVFFTESLGARDALKAELLRDPFIYPRYEIVDLSVKAQQLTARMAKLAAQIAR